LTTDQPQGGKKDAGGAGWFFGCAVFGLLMGVRAEFQSIWVRALVAGCAFAILGLCISQFRRVRD